MSPTLQHRVFVGKMVDCTDSVWVHSVEAYSDLTPVSHQPEDNELLREDSGRMRLAERPTKDVKL